MESRNNKLLDHILRFDRRLIFPIGGSSFKNFHDMVDTSNMKQEEIMAKSMDFQCREVGHDLQFMCMDDVTMCKCFGFDRFQTSDGAYHVKEGQMTTKEDIEKIRSINPYEDLAYFYNIEPIKIFKNLSNKWVGGGCFGPFTTVGAMIGINEISLKLMTNPEFIFEILEMVTEFIINMAKDSENAGADFFWIAEPLAILLSPENFGNFSGRYIKKIFNSTHLSGFMHVCGDTTVLTRELLKIDADCLSLDYKVNLREMAYEASNDVVLMGNLNPVFIQQKSEEEVKKAVIELNEDMRNYPNFIFSTGCILPWDVSPENTKILFDSTNDIKKKNRNEYKKVMELMELFLKSDIESVKKYIYENKLDRDLIFDSFEESCNYLLYRYKLKEIYLPEFLKIIMEIQNIISDEYIDLDNIIKLNGEKYVLRDIKNNFSELIIKIVSDLN